MKKILYLTLKKPQFEVTSTGEKSIEYRRPSDWIESRLIGKSYDLVKFTNGYGADKPYFICEFLGWSHAKAGLHKYSNGLVVNVSDGYFQIELGSILEIGNIK
jgi:hypothetical protein